jgi:hypothetical protein
MEMVSIKLFKNGTSVLEKEGKRDEQVLTFDNITYNLNDQILIREDDNFRFYLDFNKNISEITIKENNYKLNLKIKVINKSISNNIHEIYYNIESENVIENKIIITF